MDAINLHFTGDFHAITSAHNLLAAMIDNHIYWGNALGYRPPPHRLAARARHERPRAARNDRRARRGGQRLSARGRLRHHGRLRGDGGLLPRVGSRRSGGAGSAAWSSATRATERRSPRLDLKAEGAMTVLLKDALKPNLVQTLEAIARVRAWRAVRQYRAWLQFRRRDADRAQARRLRRDGSRFRRRSRRGEILRHQMPHGGPEARRGGDRRDGARAQDAWRGGEGRARQRGSADPEEGPRQSRAPCRQRAQIRRARCRRDQSLQRRHPGRTRSCEVERRPRRSASRRSSATIGRAAARARKPWRLRSPRSPTAARRSSVRSIRTTCPCWRRRARSRARSMAPTTSRPTESVRSEVPRPGGRRLGRLPICVAKTQYSFSDNPALLGAPTGHKAESATSACAPARASSSC